ncbi:hypothetical protein C8J57DRAFT_1215201 [Mycena rebaudengoi]|nr:hypothetical protein C8J57DRAFT_1215201 [Mycena rebaudengoi]
MQTANCGQSISENGTWAETANYWCFGTISSLLTATLPHLQHVLYQREQYDAAESWSMFWYDPTVSGMEWQAPQPLFRQQHNSALYVAVKAGMNQDHQTHRALDADALGARWAGELGSADYNAPKYFDKITPKGTYRTVENKVLLRQHNPPGRLGSSITFYGKTNSMQLCFWLCNSVQLCATLCQVMQLNAITVQLSAVVVQFNATPLLFRYYSCFEKCTRLHKMAQNIIRYNCTKLHRHLHYIAQACAQSCTKLHRTAQSCTELHSAILNKAIRLKFSRFYAETGNNSSLLTSTLHLLTCPFLLYTILPIPFVDEIPQLEGIVEVGQPCRQEEHHISSMEIHHHSQLVENQSPPTQFLVKGMTTQWSSSPAHQHRGDKVSDRGGGGRQSIEMMEGAGISGNRFEPEMQDDDWGLGTGRVAEVKKIRSSRGMWWVQGLLHPVQDVVGSQGWYCACKGLTRRGRRALRKGLTVLNPRQRPSNVPALLMATLGSKREAHCMGGLWLLGHQFQDKKRRVVLACIVICPPGKKIAVVQGHWAQAPWAARGKLMERDREDAIKPCCSCVIGTVQLDATLCN